MVFALSLPLTMVISIMKLTPLPEKRQAMLDILRSVAIIAPGMPGCLDCQIYEEDSSAHRIVYVEHWQSRGPLEQHIKSGLYLRVLTAVELASEPPEIQFHEVSETMGMELITALRTRESER